MKTSREVILDYVGGLIVWGLIFITVCEFAYVSQYIDNDGTLLNSITLASTCMMFVLLAPLGVVYVIDYFRDMMSSKKKTNRKKKSFMK